ncbi:MAG: alanine--tRNA ligase [Cytophagales bacterium]
MTSSKQIRQQFLDFFQSKQHLIVNSAPLVLKNDPTLMFTNAGMNQFKDFFLGNGTPKSRRIADTQKCLRVTGKHNDLEDVGHDTYHHTMFEMLGNWSFGDYFKKEAIEWAWELLTEVYKLPKDKLYVTVFEGDAKEGLEFDQEAYDIWANLVDKSHILRGNKKDNFWEMGDQGPCGPCSEIHIDIRPQSEIDKVSGAERVNNDDPQVIEIWNNVFMQFNRKADGSLELLPDKHVDTGMGFERLVRVIQRKSSNYDTDIFQPLIQELERQSGFKYTQGDIPKEKLDDEGVKRDIAMRVISDHLRAVSFAIADGQLPANAKAGYVIRRILRRAVRYGYTFLDFKEPFIYKLVPILAETLDIFTELKAQEVFIANVIREEETSFLRTLENGIRLLDSKFKVQSSKLIEGNIVFELYDTFGFPLDLSSLIARENGFSIDEAGFHKEMEAQKARSKNAAASEKSDWLETKHSSSAEAHEGFVGYDEFECESKISKYRKITTKDQIQYQIVLDKTPFYAESGGQVGDTGTLAFRNTPVSISIINTKKENDLAVHLTNDDLEGILASLSGQIEVVASINSENRNFTTNNHTATHLLQSALRGVLGNHVQQKGSLVNTDLLRFDFAHFSKLTDEEIAKVEQIVNKKIRENILLDEKRNVPIQKALGYGATALFGEKYGDFVRVITYDSTYSVELCGGTHVASTGNIGYFKIVSESSVAAGVRRIEAVTAAKAEQFVNEKLKIGDEVANLLKNPKDLIKAVEAFLDEKQALQKALEKYEADKIQTVKKELLQQIVVVNDINTIIVKVDISSAEAVKTLAFELKNQVENLFCVLVAAIDEKPHIAVMIADNLLKDKGLNASNIVRELAKEVQGGGGGQPFFATAGGKDLNGIDKVIEKAKAVLG